MIRTTILAFFVILALSAIGDEGRIYDEPYRPQFHFTPAKNFMNDPNGLVYYRGEYHLFYQHNPFENFWGHMSWGHAVSPDMVHWTHLPVALREENGIMVFSGSAAVDWNNSSGLCVSTDPSDPSCLVAVYTGHGHGLQTQNLAYSNDNGRTWTKYAGNPVLDIGSAEFRDPKLIWHEATQKWVLVTVLAQEFKVRFWGSKDLIHWEKLSDFGPAAATGGVWECPDLFQLPVDDPPDRSKWVLIVNINPGGVAGGSGCQYFVGQFDGERFVNENPGGEALWADYGRDFYAAVSWGDVPASDGRRLWIGWMSNWDYANVVPTDPWRSAQALPRRLQLKRYPEGVRLVQTPVEELQTLRRDHYTWENVPLAADAARAFPELSRELLEVTAELDTGSASEVGFRVRKGGSEETVIGYDVDKGELFVDRTHSGRSDFSDKFAEVHRVALTADNGRIRLHFFLDRSSVEVFANGGRRVITDLILPKPDSLGFEGYAKGGEAKLISLRAWRLAPAWE